MMIETTTLGSGCFLPKNTQAQIATIAKLEAGLDFPVQARAAIISDILCPIWTDGDGGFYAIQRDGNTVSL